MATVYNTEIVRDGLTFYMDMMNAKSYSGTGNKINDLSGLDRFIGRPVSRLCQYTCSILYADCLFDD